MNKMSNFLATDEVPETIFGIPVVTRDYTPEDLAFFKAHPEAGGYYDMGAEAEPDDDDPPTQGAVKAGDTFVDKVKRRIGETGEVIDAGIARTERGLVKAADTGLPVVSQLGKILQPAAVGVRAAVANATSGGGKYYQPEVRDERYFSKDAKRQIADALKKNGGRGVGRYDYKADTAGWEASQALGGASVKDGKLTDVFDVNREDPYGLVTGLRGAAETYASQGKMAKAIAFGTLGNLAEMGHRALGAVFGGDKDPDKGKVRTEIPLSKLSGTSGVEGGGDAGGSHDDPEQDTSKARRPIVRGDDVVDVKGTGYKRAGRRDRGTFIPLRGKYPGVSNNPGNVEKHERRTDKTLFAGENGGGVRPKRFANFDDPVSGLNAAAAVLARRANGLAKEGKPFTIENYVPSYAPASENDTEGYIQNISKYSGFARNAELDRWDVDGMAKLLKTVVRFESGKPHSDWFTDEEYKAAAERLQEGAFD